MADAKPETTEPDPSSTGISNDMSVNADTVMEDSNPTAEANSKTQTDLPSSNDVDKAIAEVEARRKPEKLSSEEVAVETNGHEASEKKTDPITAQKSEPSERVKEGQRWNNRDRHGQPGRPGAKDSKKPWKENYKSDLTSQEESSDPVAIRKQVNQSMCSSTYEADADLP